MLVEDDNNLREIYGARLSAEGYEIVFAQDGEEALALAVKEKPELIVSDVMMPKISGFDMLDILRNAPETRSTKVIMMTALSQEEDKERAKKLGADKYLVKSQVTLEDVVKAVKSVLGDEGPTTEAAATPLKPNLVENQSPITESPALPPNAPPIEPVVNDQPTQEPVTQEASPQQSNSQPNADPDASQTAQTTSEDAPITQTPSTAESIASETLTPPVADPPPTQQISVTTDDQQTTDATAGDPGASVLATPTVPITVTLPDDSTPPEGDNDTLLQTNRGQSTDDNTQPPSLPPSDDPVAASDEPVEPVVAKPSLGDDSSTTPVEPSIGPNLSEALEDVKNELHEDINSLGNNETAAPTAPPVTDMASAPSNSDDQPKIEEPTNADPPEATPDSSAAISNGVPGPTIIQPTTALPDPSPEPTPEPPSNTGGIVEDQNGKKVINPINDLNSKPDLNKLLAEEQAKAGLEKPPINSVISPANSTEQATPPSNTPIIINSDIQPVPAPDPNNNIAL